MPHEETGWFKNKEDEEKLSPAIQGINTIQSNKLIERISENYHAILDISKNITIQIEKLDEKFKAPVGTDLEKIEDSFAYIKNILQQECAKLSIEIKEYTTLHPDLQENFIQTHLFIQKLTDLLPDLKNTKITSEEIIEVWVTIKDNLLVELEKTKELLMTTKDNGVVNPISLN